MVKGSDQSYLSNPPTPNTILMVHLLPLLHEGAGRAAVGEEEVVAPGPGEVVLAAHILAVEALKDAL